jgi:FOG: PKD repeat
MTNSCFITSVSATYTLTMEPPGSCQPLVRIITTTITPAPLLVISAVQAICGNTLATISVTPSGSAANPLFINWSPVPLTLNTQTTVGTYTIPPGPASTTVSVTASDPIGCLITATALVNPAAPAPTVAVVNNTGTYSLTCVTPSIDLSVTTTYTYGTLDYIWQSSSFSYSATNVLINTTYTAPYTVTLTAKDPVTLCADTKLITIFTNTVRPVSSITPTFQSLICGQTPQTVTLTSISPTVNVSHLILDPFSGTFSSTAVQMIYTPAPGTYTHILADMINGCTTVKQFTVFTNDNFPTFTLSSTPANYTLGCTTKSVITISINNAQVQGGAAVSYTMLPPGASNPPSTGTLGVNATFTVNAPGTYTVITRADVSWCDTRLPISVISNTFGPNIDTVIVPRKVLDCNVPKTVIQGISRSTGTNVAFNWTFHQTPANQAGDTLGVYADFSKRTTTLVDTYTLTVKDLNSTCISTTLVPVYQNLFAPIARITGTAPLTCIVPTVQLSNFSEANPSIPPFFAGTKVVKGLLWEGPSPQIPLSNSSSYIGYEPGAYTLTAQDVDNGCTSQTTAIIPDNRVYPIFTIANGTVECASSTTLVPAVTSGSTALIYSWTGPPGTPTTQIGSKLITETPGEYNVTITNTVNGCTNSGSVQVVSGKLVPEIVVDKTTGYAPLTVNFTNNSHTSTNDTSKIVSVWSFGNGTTNTVSTRAPRSAIYNQPGTYTVTLYVAKGNCLETIQKVIQVELPSSLTVPNVFTPNGDGVNDLYFMKTTNLSEVNAVIYDRWGHLVYKLDGESNIAWDGKNQQGQDVSEGTYYYIIKAKGKDGKDYEEKGTISLFR